MMAGISLRSESSALVELIGEDTLDLPSLETSSQIHDERSSLRDALMFVVMTEQKHRRTIVKAGSALELSEDDKVQRQVETPNEFEGLSEAESSEPGANKGNAETAEDQHAAAWRADVAELWQAVKELKHKEKKQSSFNDSSGEVGTSRAAKKGSVVNKHRGFLEEFRSSFFGRSKQQNGGSGAADKEGKEVDSFFDSGVNAGMSMPQTFEEMTRFQGTMVGANVVLISIIVDFFDSLVAYVCDQDDAGLEQQARILALRIHREVTGKVVLKEFRLCMLASLRSLLPKRWSMQAEKNWVELWDIVEERLEPMLPLPAKYKQHVQNFVSGLDAQEIKTMGLDVFARLFEAEPAAEKYFNQSNDRLCFIVGRAFRYGVDIYHEPEKIAKEVQSLGIRHIMFQVATAFFQPFVRVMLEVAQDQCDEPVLLQGLAWSLETVAAIMIHTIDEGSSPLLTAVLNNKPKDIVRELGKVPRGKRAGAALGTAVWVKGHWVWA